MLKGKEIACLEDVKIVNCEKLNLSDNLLKDFQGIEKFGEKVTWLNASHNQINSVKHLKCCTKLNVLNISYNKISSISSIRKLKDLKALIVNNNELKSLDGVQALKQLNTLVISGNDLDSVDVTPLSKLEKFSASNNRLTEFPNLQPLKDVKDLKLNNNRIQIIPSWITSCKRIKVLDLGNNQLKDIESIKILNQLPFLENLNLKGNELCDVEDYHIKMKALFPSLKILDYKKISELYFKAIEAKDREGSHNKDDKKKIETKLSSDLQRDRGFKHSKMKRQVEQNEPMPTIKVELNEAPDTRRTDVENEFEDDKKMEERENSVDSINNDKTSSIEKRTKTIEDVKIGQKRKTSHSPDEKSAKQKKKKKKKKDDDSIDKKRVVSKEKKRRTGVVSLVTIKKVNKKDFRRENFTPNKVDIPQW